MVNLSVSAAQQLCPLMITTLVATSLVVGPSLLWATCCTDPRRMKSAGMLTGFKCVCGHARCLGMALFGNIEWHCHDSHDPVKLTLAEGDSVTVVDGSGLRVLNVKLCSLTVVHSRRRLHVRRPRARSHHPPPGSRQPDHNFLLRVSEFPWFNLPLHSSKLMNMVISRT